MNSATEPGVLAAFAKLSFDAPTISMTFCGMDCLLLLSRSISLPKRGSTGDEHEKRARALSSPRPSALAQPRASNVLQSGQATYSFVFVSPAAAPSSTRRDPHTGQGSVFCASVDSSTNSSAFPYHPEIDEATLWQLSQWSISSRLGSGRAVCIPAMISAITSAGRFWK